MWGQWVRGGGVKLAEGQGDGSVLGIWQSGCPRVWGVKSVGELIGIWGLWMRLGEA